MKHREFFLVLALVALTSAGCSKTTPTDVNSLGKTIGTNVTEFAKGVGSGVDTQLQIVVELSPSVIDAGVSHTVSKQEGPFDAPKKVISVYFISSKEFKGTLCSKAYNKEELEIGRALADVHLIEDDAQYVQFSFPPEMDRQMVALYRIDVRP